MRPIHLALLALPLLGGLRHHPAPAVRSAVPRRASHRRRPTCTRPPRRSTGGTGWCRRGSSTGCTIVSHRPGSCSLCTADDGEPMYDKRPINRAAETAKLAALQAEQKRLDAAIAACRAHYPE